MKTPFVFVFSNLPSRAHSGRARVQTSSACGGLRPREENEVRQTNTGRFSVRLEVTILQIIIPSDFSSFVWA